MLIMPREPLRSITARAAAELALVRVINEYGEMPNFVVLGGLVPALLCGNSAWMHAGTTDIDVQADEGQLKCVSARVAGLAGFLMAKTAAAHSRSKPQDWYDIAFVLLNNDLGGVEAAAARVKTVFPKVLDGPGRTWLIELHANFTDSQSQGVTAYVSQMSLDHPELELVSISADAILAVGQFCEGIGLL